MPTPTAYLISTKRNTARADFDEFIKTLPDQGQGNVIAYDNIPWQSYVTKNLTAEQADMIKMNSIVELIGLITEQDGEAGIAAARGKPCSPKSRLLKRETSPRAGSDYHLGILSAPRALMDTEDWPDYEFDTQLGTGQTIYIIDSGFRSTHEVAMAKIGSFRNIYLLRYRNSPQRVALSTAMSCQMLSHFQSPLLSQMTISLRPRT